MILKRFFIVGVLLATIIGCSNGSDDNRGVKKQAVKEEDIRQIEAKRNNLLQKVSACGWRSAPESAGFFLGMSLNEVRTFATAKGYTMTCRESSPITGGSVSELVQKMLNDEFTVNKDWRALHLCETEVDGNEINLYLFKTTSDSEPILAKAYNSLDNYQKSTPFDTYAAATPVLDALSDKFGFDVNRGNDCSIDSGSGYMSNFSVTFARPFPDRTPNQPNISLFFAVSDRELIRIGGAFTKQRDDAAEKNREQSEKSELRGKASKL
jgi:hypothetical protein